MADLVTGEQLKTAVDEKLAELTPILVKALTDEGAEIRTFISETLTKEGVSVEVKDSILAKFDGFASAMVAGIQNVSVDAGIPSLPSGGDGGGGTPP